MYLQFLAREDDGTRRSAVSGKKVKDPPFLSMFRHVIVKTSLPCPKILLTHQILGLKNDFEKGQMRSVTST